MTIAASLSSIDVPAISDRDTALRDPVATVSVVSTLAAAHASWHALAERAPASPYQSFRWVDTWVETLGRRQAITPAVIVAADAAGEPLAVLPLGVGRRAGLCWAEFLGGRESNGNMGLFDAAIDWTPALLAVLLKQAAADAGIDVFSLSNQRERWRGTANPLRRLGGQPSPSASHASLLAPDPDAFLHDTLSAHARKTLRQKQRRLASLGAVRSIKARTAAEVDAILETYLTQKQARFETLGIGALDDLAGHRAFLAAAADPAARGGAAIELHALACGDRLVATFGGTGNRQRFSGMFISFDASEAIARCSPGDLLLAAVIAEKCRAGVESFDLGIGEARYKDTFCPESEPLFDLFVGITPLGRLAVRLSALAARAKRSVKQNPLAWAAAQRVRRGLLGRPSRP